MLAKLKRFIYKLRDTIKYWKSELVLFHQKILLTNEEHINDKIYSRNPYQILFDWLLNCFQFGIVATMVYLTIESWHTWIKWLLMPFTLGMAKWVFEDVIQSIKKPFKEGG